MNNEALAMADAGRTSDAIRLYTKAIEIARACFERQPDSAPLPRFLAKPISIIGRRCVLSSDSTMQPPRH